MMTKDESMNVWACLPREPHGASRHEIALDAFGVANRTTQARVSQAMNQLRRQGIVLLCGLDKERSTAERRVVSVSSASWAQFKELLRDWKP